MASKQRKFELNRRQQRTVRCALRIAIDSEYEFIEANRKRFGRGFHDKATVHNSKRFIRNAEKLLAELEGHNHE